MHAKTIDYGFKRLFCDMLCVEMLFMSWVYSLSFAWTYQSPLSAEMRILPIVGMLAVGFGVPALFRVPRAEILKTASDSLIDGGAFIAVIPIIVGIISKVFHFELQLSLGIAVGVSGIIMVVIGDIIASINRDSPIHVRLLKEISKLIQHRIQRRFR